jgi:hypothetical protein
MNAHIDLKTLHMIHSYSFKICIILIYLIIKSSQIDFKKFYIYIFIDTIYYIFY